MKKKLKMGQTAAALLLAAVLLAGCGSEAEKEKAAFLEWTEDLMVSDCRIFSPASERETSAFLSALQALIPEELEESEVELASLHEAAVLKKDGRTAKVLADDRCRTIIVSIGENLWKADSEMLREMTGRIWEPDVRGIFYPGTPEWNQYVPEKTAIYGRQIAFEQGGKLEYLERLPLGMAAERCAYDLLYVGDSETEKKDRRIIVMYQSEDQSGKWNKLGKLTDAEVQEKYDGDYRKAAQELLMQKLLSSYYDPEE